MFTIVQPSVFAEWLSGSRIGRARRGYWLGRPVRNTAILATARPLAKAFPRCGFTSDRVIRNGATVYVLLNGGDKGSQKRDIERAKAMARELREQDG